MTRNPSAPESESAEEQALLEAMTAVLEPLARLAVTRGVSFPAFEALAKEAFVRTAHAAHPDLPQHRRVSRISTSTGLSRREVTRIVQAPERAQPPRSIASEVFARWMSDAAWRTARGRPRPLPRQGPAPSFEALAHSVTRDVHPRSLLEELVRLGLAVLDPATDIVSLSSEAFVPRGDAVRMVRFLGDNVGDHMACAVANVLGGGRTHFEQALFADGLSEASLVEFRALVTRQWQALREAMVPVLQALIDADRAANRERGHRLRLGLYTFTQSAQPGADPAPRLSVKKQASRRKP